MMKTLMADDEFNTYMGDLITLFTSLDLIDRLTDEQFDRCIRERPSAALYNYSKFKDRLTDEQFDRCVHKEPWSALRFYKKLDTYKFNEYYE